MILVLLFFAGMIASAQTASLSSSEAQQRARAVYDLRQKGPKPEVIAIMVQMLGDASPEVRRSAADSLGNFGADSKDAVRALIPILQDQTELVRETAARSLGLIGPAAAEAISAIVPLLYHRSSSVRWSAVQGLGGIGPAAAGMRATIAALGNDDDEHVRAGVITALANIATRGEEALPYIAAGLRDPKPYVRYAAASAMSQWAVSATGMSLELHKALADSEDIVQGAAMGAIFRMPKRNAAEFVDDLVRILDNPANHFGARSGAADALGSIGEPAKVAAPDLRFALHDQHEWVQRAAARALRTLALPTDGPSSARYSTTKNGPLENAAARLSSPDENVRIDALYEMAKFEERIAPYAAAVTKRLKSGSTREKSAAIRVLGGMRKGTDAIIPQMLLTLKDAQLQPVVLAAFRHMGPGAAPAVPALIQLLGEVKGEALRETIMALSEIGGQAGQAALPLADLLTHSELSIRLAALYALNHLWADAAPALPALFAALNDEVAQVRADAAYAIGQVYAGCPTSVVPPLPSPAGARLVAMLSEEHSGSREWASYALSWTWPVPAGAIPGLQAAVADNSYQVRMKAVRALGKIGGPQVVATLVRALADPSDFVRANAASALGDLKGASQTSLPALRRAATDQSLEVRRAADRAIQQISSDEKTAP